MQQTTEQNQRGLLERQRFEEFEHQRLLTDELTEASEKLAMVMNNSFEFDMREDGELYFQDGSVGEVLRNSVLVAEEIVKTNPQFMVELIRRRIELQEYDEQRRLALSNEGDPDVLVVLSPIPDAVVAGTDLGAYDQQRMKTLARIYERTESGIRSTSLSLDRTDRKGLQAIARQFGQSISDDDGSEDILAMRMWGYRSVLHDPVKTVRRRYDEQLERQFGGEWYAGRQDGDVVDALTFIKQQTDIIDAHMQRMSVINHASIHERDELRKRARYDFAAALDRRRHGGTSFGDGGDLLGSGSEAREAGIEYSSDCPTGPSDPTGQPGNVASAVNKLFGKTKKEFISKVCPMCGDKNVLTKINGSIISGSCGCARDICTNEEISVNRRKGIESNTPRDHKKDTKTRSRRGSEHTHESVKQAYGKHARIKLQISIGAASMVAYDWRTDQVISVLERN